MKTTILTLALLLASQLLSAQTRGTSPGELYFSTTWYYTDTEQYDMIIHSTNNGKNFKPTYVYKHDSGNTPVGSVLADATPGVLYMTSNNKLHISYDSTKSWEFVEETELDGRYACGANQGEVYKYDLTEQPNIYRSANFADAFNLQNQSIGGHLEVGLEISNLYLLAIHTWPELDITLHKSFDYAISFDTLHFDIDTGGYYLSGHSPQISRGAINGELYIVSWHLPANYKIFRSTNYGETFTLQYEQSDTCDFYYEGYGFTAGRDPGEFYIFKNESWFDGTNTKLHVYYSSDYAKTFTEYVHVFNKEWTEISEELKVNNEKLVCYPNPFKELATITYSGNILKNGVVEIYNINGQLIKTLPMEGNNVEWNSGNNKPGIYLYRIKAENYISETQTMIIQ